MKRRILLFMMTALLSVGTWAAEDLTLNPSETVSFGEWGFDNSEAPTLNFSNWAGGGGWQFETALSQDDYYGVDIAFEATTETHVTFFIDFEGGAEQSIDVPTGSTGIKADFAYTGGITKIGFKYGDWEATANPDGCSITITSAVVKANSTGEVVELAFADLNDDTKDEANKAITLERYNSAPSWTFNPALSSGDYEKLVVTFAEAIPEEGLTVTLNGETFTGLVCGATKATAYFTSGVSIESIGFSYGWNSKQGDTDEAPTATLKIAKVELVKKASDTPTEPTDPDATTYGVIMEQNIKNGTIVADNLSAAEGTTVTLTITSDAGYQLSKLIIEKTAEPESANARRRVPAVGSFITATKQNDGTWTFVMPACPVIISATFAQKTLEPTLAYDKATRTVTITNTEYADGNNVTATLYYTLNDGTEQTTTDASVSEVITENTAVKAWIVSTETGSSDNVEETFSVAAKPTVAYTDGENKVSLALTAATDTNTADSKLYYTTDGTNPTTNSTAMTAAGNIDITENMTTIKVLALDANGNYSEIVTQNVTYAYYLTASKEWTTYYSDKTFSVPTGLKAYTVTSVTAPANGQSGTIEVTEQTVIAKNTPMLIFNDDAGTTNKYRVYTTTDQTISGTASEFKGVATATDLTDDGTLRYILVNNVFLRTTGGTLPANRCYLEFGSTSAQTRSFSITVGDKTTAIESVGITTQEGEDLWYDLQGRRVMQPQKGIYIRNGKKVVVH